MTLSKLQNLFRMRPRDATAADLKDIDRLDIPKNIPDPVISELECEGHLYLLEQIISARERMNIWARHHHMQPDAAWTIYINSAVPRLAKWLQYVGWGSISTAVPPLDVLIVWHAFMQDPVQWHAFTEATGLEFEKWNWITLLKVLDMSQYGDFALSDTSSAVALKLFTTIDMLKVFDEDMPAIIANDTGGPFTTRNLHRENTVRIRTPNEEVEFQFDFHRAVDHQLEFAFRMSQYSWHRLSTPKKSLADKWRRSIKRYNRFMAIKRYWHIVSSMDSLSCGPMVPTEDVDLVWRTHLLRPEAYRSFSHDMCHGIISHAASIPKNIESHEFETTAKVYEHVFGKEYCVCLCWYCIAGRDSHRVFRNGQHRHVKSNLKQEISRRKMAVLFVSPLLAIRQCSNCGSHQDRECKEKHVVRQHQKTTVLFNPRFGALGGAADDTKSTYFPRVLPPFLSALSEWRKSRNESPMSRALENGGKRPRRDQSSDWYGAVSTASTLGKSTFPPISTLQRRSTSLSRFSDSDDEHYIHYHDKIHDILEGSPQKQRNYGSKGDPSCLRLGSAIRRSSCLSKESDPEQYYSSGALQGPDPELDNNQLGLAVAWRSNTSLALRYVVSG